MEANELVQLLLGQNRLVVKLSRRGANVVISREHRRLTKRLMAAMLGRDPTADELDTVCNR